VFQNLLPVLKGCNESLATNALKHLMDQLEERILQTNQLKRLQHCIDRTP